MAKPDEEAPQANVMGQGSMRVLSPRLWALICLTGAGAGLAGGLLLELLRLVAHLAWPYPPGGDFVAAVRAAPPLRRSGVVFGAGLLTAFVPLILRRTLGGGHGGDLAQKIWFDAGHLSPVRTSIRAVLSIVIVGMGASLGRESAPKQSGALAGSLLGRWGHLPPSQRRLLVACGAGAGVAAAYNVPVGGALFALEVLLGSLSLSLVPPAIATSVIAVAVSWLFLPNAPAYSIEHWTVDSRLVTFAIVAGPIAGVVSALYVRLIAFADRQIPRGAWSVAAPLVVFAGLGALALPFPELLGNGKDLVQQTFAGSLALPLLAALIVLKPIATAACLGSGAPGGLFTPTMTLGAVLGAALGLLWLSIWPGGPVGPYAAVGAAAVLAAATQGPLSAIVLSIELTRRLDWIILPVALSVATATATARAMETRSVYSARVHLGRLAIDSAENSVSAAARVAELMRALLKANGAPVKVVGQDGQVMGEVTAAILVDPPAQARPLETAAAADFVGAQRS
ncbi:MAG TPA: chloride channel protein [Caulobacteraceae bacterium]|jgi:H+/Cl- antiporter ClcA